MTSQVGQFLAVGLGTLAAFGIGIAVWFGPTVLAARALRKIYPSNVVVIAQGSPDLAHGLARLSQTEVIAVPSYFIVMVNQTGVVFLKSEDSAPMVTVLPEMIVGIRRAVAGLPRASSGIAFECALHDGSRVLLPFVPSRRSAELWPAPASELDEVLGSMAEALGRPILS